jgi:hypothetical protein
MFHKCVHRNSYDECFCCYLFIGIPLYGPLHSTSANGCSGHQGDIDEEMRGRLPFLHLRQAPRLRLLPLDYFIFLHLFRGGISAILFNLSSTRNLVGRSINLVITCQSFLSSERLNVMQTQCDTLLVLCEMIAHV